MLDKNGKIVYNKNMLIAAIVCMAVAVVALGVGLCFSSKNRVLFSLLSTFCLIALVCLGICVAAFKNEFSGFAILLIVSVCPLFALVNLPQKNEVQQEDKQENLNENLQEHTATDAENLNASSLNKTETLPNEGAENLQAQTHPFDANKIKQNLDIDENSTKTEQNLKKNTKFGAFLADFGGVVSGAAYLLSALAIAFCGLYIGKESGWVFALGVALGLALTFLDGLVTKAWKGKKGKALLADYAQSFLLFTSVGLLVGAMLLALLYSLTPAHILFALGCLIYAAHILLQQYIKTTFNHLPLLLAILLLFSTLLF